MKPTAQIPESTIETLDQKITDILERLPSNKEDTRGLFRPPTPGVEGPRLSPLVLADRICCPITIEGRGEFFVTLVYGEKETFQGKTTGSNGYRIITPEGLVWTNLNQSWRPTRSSKTRKHMENEHVKLQPEEALSEENKEILIHLLETATDQLTEGNSPRIAITNPQSELYDKPDLPQRFHYFAKTRRPNDPLGPFETLEATGETDRINRSILTTESCELTGELLTLMFQLKQAALELAQEQSSTTGTGIPRPKNTLTTTRYPVSIDGQEFEIDIVMDSKFGRYETKLTTYTISIPNADLSIQLIADPRIYKAIDRDLWRGKQGLDSYLGIYVSANNQPVFYRSPGIYCQSYSGGNVVEGIKLINYVTNTLLQILASKPKLEVFDEQEHKAAQVAKATAKVRARLSI